MVLEGGGVGQDRKEGGHAGVSSPSVTPLPVMTDVFGLALSLIVHAMDPHTPAVCIHPFDITEGPDTQSR